MSDVVITPNRGVATEGKIEFFSGVTPALSGTISISSGNITIVPEGAGTVQVGKVGNTTTIPGNLTVTGNLTINGTTTTVNSTTVTVDDPIFTIGGDSAPASDDNKDRGIAFRWHNGSAAKLGFFGYDDSTGKFTFIADATDTSDVFSGTTGEIDAKLDWSNVLNKPTIGTGTVTNVSGTSPVSVANQTTTPVVSLASGYGDTQNPYASKTANFFLAAPNGTAGAPTFRAIVAADIPTLNQNTTGTAANVTGTVAIGNGGTGATTAPNARTNLGATTVGSNLFTLTNPSAISFLRVNADNTVTAQTAANFRTDLGATTVGSNLFTLTNPGAITFLRVNADNTVTARSAADFRTDIGAGTGNGTVTSVGFTGGIISVATGTTTPAFTVAGTSGGIPYFSSASTWATSAALAANALVVGGGAGAAPSTITTGTNVITALGVNVGSAGAFVTNGGALGTPSSGTLSSCTGLPISTGVSGLGSNVATFLATPSSANLASAITDETGSGALVFGTSPSLTTPSLSGETFSTSATVTAGTNAQGQGALTSDYNVITTAAATPSGVTLPTATTGRRIVVVNKGANTVFVYPATGGYIDGLAINTGRQLLSGSVMVFYASSTTQWYSTANLEFASPFLGTASATSINKLAITAPATSATLTIANGKTLTCSNTLTFTGTDSSSVAFGGGGTVLYSGGALGTPSSGTLSNCTGLPVSTGISGLGTGVATALAVNVGTAGAFVTNGGALGTPSSGTLSSCTGLPVSTGISGLGTGVATFLATPSSANLASALTSKTGTGDNVFGTSPTITTSLIAGSATMALFNTTATTINFGGAATTMTIGATGSGTVTIGYNLTVTNKLEATTKSFVIDHPTKWKEGMKLRYACLEGPENGVYVRGALEDNDTIELPEYWVNLVDADSITVNLTPIGSSNGHYVKSIKNNVITVGSRSGNINCHYIVYGERKDVSKLVIEYHAGQ